MRTRSARGDPRALPLLSILLRAYSFHPFFLPLGRRPRRLRDGLKNSYVSESLIVLVLLLICEKVERVFFFYTKHNKRSQVIMVKQNQSRETRITFGTLLTVQTVLIVRDDHGLTETISLEKTSLPM